MYVAIATTWEQRKLRDIVEIVGGGTPDTTNSDYWNGDIDWYSPSEIGDQIYATQSLKKVTSLGLSKSSAKILPKDKTILFTSRASIGDMAILKNQATTNQGFQSFVVIDDIHVYFLYSMGNKIKEFALKNASGSTFLEISKNQLSRMDISLPSLEEQTAIGNFFKQLDDTITLHQRELDKLKILKKAYLKSIFVDKTTLFCSKNAITWEQRKLGDVVGFFSGLTYSPDDVIDDYGTLVLRSSNIQDNQIVLNDNIYVVSKCVNSKNVQIGDIIVVVRNGSKNLIGKHALVNHSMRNTVIGAFMTGIRSNNPEFFNALLDTKNFNAAVEKNLGATINQITAGAFKSMRFFVPSQKEQTAIGNFFKQLDDTIALHQKELNKYNQIKAACLEKMFV